MHFKMHVGACAVSGIAGKRDLTALGHRVANIHKQCAVVCIECFQTILMVNDDIVAIAVRPFGNNDLAIVGRIDWRTFRYR